MAVVSPPVFIQAGSHPAASVRQAFKGLLGQRGGIMHPSHLAVTANGTPNMSVNVAEGQVAIPGTENSYQGIYLCEAQGTTNLAISASSANPRIDLVVARIRDAAYATGPSSNFSLEVITGTPAASPVAPSVPANCWVLAQVSVGASVTAITAPDVQDRRTTATGQFGLAGPAGHRVICTSGTRPTSPWAGMEIFEANTGRTYIYTGADWVVPYPLGRVGSNTLAANSANFTAIIYPLSVTATLLPNRRIRVKIHANVYSGTVGASVTVAVCNGAGTILNQAPRIIGTAGTSEQISVEHLATSGAGGSTTFQLGCYANASSLISAGSTTYTSISIIDEGPS